VWKAIARQMGPQALQMNLNTLLRHGVLGDGRNDREMVDYVAGRIADADDIRRSRQLRPRREKTSLALFSLADWLLPPASRHGRPAPTPAGAHRAVTLDAPGRRRFHPSR